MKTNNIAKMSFDKIFNLTAGVYFNFYNNNQLKKTMYIVAGTTGYTTEIGYL